MNANALQVLRKRRRLTQAELARRAGVHQTLVSDLERGKNANPSWASANRIAQALRVKPHRIFPVPALPDHDAASASEERS